ncbi:MAG: hypothetical protein BWY62_00805 [Firmicutes bacterium ADurb.Bin356]|nr:MAG: hypothetical protein BWY62_00805 [Firmicutes bacterium ADurb.Bin356]
MAGIMISFVFPGILIGLLVSQALNTVAKKAQLLEKKRAQKKQNRLYIYDLRSDQAA